MTISDAIFKIQEHCKNNLCNDCDLYRDEKNKCMLNGLPLNWNLDDLNEDKVDKIVDENE